MPNFVIERVEGIDGKIPFYLLSVDDICLYDAFFEELKQNGNNDFKKSVHLQTIMNQVSHLKSLPDEKWKNITIGSSIAKEYEAKRDGVRAYVFHDNDYGRIIALAGAKTNQSKDLNRFRRIILEYFSNNKKDVTIKRTT